MKTLWLTLLSALVVALASLYLTSRPTLDRSLLNPPLVPTSSITDPAAAGTNYGRTPSGAPKRDAMTAPVAATAPERAHPSVVPPTNVGPPTPPPSPVTSTATKSSAPPPPVASVTASARNSAVLPEPPALRRSSPAAPSALSAQTPSRLPLGERGAPAADQLGAAGTAAVSTASSRQAAQCRALTAYLRDLQQRAERASSASEAAMVAEQRRITHTRQLELACGS